MGPVDAITILNGVRDNLNEPLDGSLMTDPVQGSTYTNQYLLHCLNKSLDRAWAVIKGVRENFFQISDTITLSTSLKEFSLASDFRDLIGIKTTTSGYETLKFTRLSQETASFQYLDALPASGGTVSELFYAIIAQSKIKFATYPPAALTVAYDYIQRLTPYTLSAASTSNIDDEHQEFLEGYTTYKALLKNPGDQRIASWRPEISRLEENMMKSVKQRNQRESRRIEPFSI